MGTRALCIWPAGCRRGKEKGVESDESMWNRTECVYAGTSRRARPAVTVVVMAATVAMAVAVLAMAVAAVVMEVTVATATAVVAVAIAAYVRNLKYAGFTKYAVEDFAAV